MRAVIQRVTRASVTVDGREVAAIGHGLVVLVGFATTDTEQQLQWMSGKILSLRLFADDAGKMNLDLAAAEGELLVVSQFTLYGDCKKGKRPSFDRSAPAELATGLYDRFLDIVRAQAPGRVDSGVFQAHMLVNLVNDGPVTLIVDKEAS